jgi:hypothetical protein
MNPFMCILCIIVTSLYLHSLVYIPLQLMIFAIFSSFSFEIHYRTEAVVSQNILKTTCIYSAQL